MCKGAASSRGGFFPNKAFLPTADKISYQLGPPLLSTKDGRESEGRGEEGQGAERKGEDKREKRKGEDEGEGERSERREGGRLQSARVVWLQDTHNPDSSGVRTGAPGSSFYYL